MMLLNKFDAHEPTYCLSFQDLSEVLMPTGRKLMLVSNGAVLLRIKRADFLRYSTKTTIKCARDIALQSE